MTIGDDLLRPYFGEKWRTTASGSAHGTLMNAWRFARDRSSKALAENNRFIALAGQSLWRGKYHDGGGGATPFDEAVAEFDRRQRRAEEAYGISDGGDHDHPTVGVVYFVQSGDLVKIGFSTDLRKRLKTLQTACPRPIVLLHRFQGTRDDEKRVHRRFSHLRMRGEWFAPDVVLMEFVMSKPLAEDI